MTLDELFNNAKNGTQDAGYEEGHVSHRKNGDFIKQGGTWVPMKGQKQEGAEKTEAGADEQTMRQSLINFMTKGAPHTTEADAKKAVENLDPETLNQMFEGLKEQHGDKFLAKQEEAAPDYDKEKMDREDEKHEAARKDAEERNASEGQPNTTQSSAAELKLWEKSAKTDAKLSGENQVIFQDANGNCVMYAEGDSDGEAKAEAHGYKKMSLVRPDGSVKRHQGNNPEPTLASTFEAAKNKLTPEQEAEVKARKQKEAEKEDIIRNWLDETGLMKKEAPAAESREDKLNKIRTVHSSEKLGNGQTIELTESKKNGNFYVKIDGQAMSAYRSKEAAQKEYDAFKRGEDPVTERGNKLLSSYNEKHPESPMELKTPRNFTEPAAGSNIDSVVNRIKEKLPANLRYSTYQDADKIASEYDITPEEAEQVRQKLRQEESKNPDSYYSAAGSTREDNTIFKGQAGRTLNNNVQAAGPQRDVSAENRAYHERVEKERAERNASAQQSAQTAAQEAKQKGYTGETLKDFMLSKTYEGSSVSVTQRGMEAQGWSLTKGEDGLNVYEKPDGSKVTMQLEGNKVKSAEYQPAGSTENSATKLKGQKLNEVTTTYGDGSKQVYKITGGENDVANEFFRTHGQRFSFMDTDVNVDKYVKPIDKNSFELKLWNRGNTAKGLYGKLAPSNNNTDDRYIVTKTKDGWEMKQTYRGNYGGIGAFEKSYKLDNNQFSRDEAPLITAQSVNGPREKMERKLTGDCKVKLSKIKR